MTHPRRYQFTTEKLRAMSESALIHALRMSSLFAERVAALRGDVVFPDYLEHNEILARIGGDQARIERELFCRLENPQEPRPWGENGPEEDCLAFVIWKHGKPNWETVRWVDEGLDHYRFIGTDEDIRECAERVTHWLPLPKNPE